MSEASTGETHSELGSGLRGGPLPLPDSFKKFLALSVVLNVIAVAIWAWNHYHLHLTEYPYGTYLFPGSQFDDLTGYIERFRFFHSVRFFDPLLPGPYRYPPGVAPFYEALNLTGHALAAFFIASAALILAFAVWLVRRMRASGIGLLASIVFVCGTLVCSYVLLFELSRANTEIFLSTLCICGVYFMLRGKPAAAAICFGVAGSMKIYPLVYLGLLISKRQYRQFFLGLPACAAFTLFSLWAICPDLRVSIVGVRAGLRAFGGLYTLLLMQPQGGYDHAAFYFVKRMLGNQPIPFLHKALSIYMLVCAVGLLWLYFKRMRRLPFVNELICFMAAAALVPPTSFEYTLLQLYTPWLVLVWITIQEQRAGRKIARGTTALFVLFALLFSNLGELVWHGHRDEGIAKAFVIFALMLVALRYPIPGTPDELRAFGDRRLGEPALPA